VSILTQPGTLDDRTVVRRIGALMVFEAATLAIASVLHLSGDVHGRSKPFNADHAGLAEAIIGVVLACGAGMLLRAPDRARNIGLAATGFASIGFAVGLNFTARGGDIPDVAYHVTLLPVLIGSMVVLLRVGRRRSHG
jgi:peptidoglycan/LPS O-acetylase OafA/YrhL